MNSFTISKALF